MNEFAAISPQIWLDPVIANFRIAFASSSLSPTSFECWLDLSSILKARMKALVVKSSKYSMCTAWGIMRGNITVYLLSPYLTLTVLVQLVNLDMQTIGLKDSLTTVVCTAALTSGSLIRISGLSYLLAGICFS